MKAVRLSKAVAQALFVVVVAAPLSAAAHGPGAHAGKAAQSAPRKVEMVETVFGRTGDPARVSRTIAIEMRDTMRFAPDLIEVRRNETVRLAVRNAGAVLHELVIGTEVELREHAELMKKFPGMEHDEPYMAHVEAGRSGEIVWQFTRAGEFRFGCLVPGHFEAGMTGRILVRD
jgi:uncharacterized cupredoxin-like copper-binding protein